MKCPICGGILKNKPKFCMFCGTRLDDDKLIERMKDSTDQEDYAIASKKSASKKIILIISVLLVIGILISIVVAIVVDNTGNKNASDKPVPQQITDNANEDSNQILLHVKIQDITGKPMGEVHVCLYKEMEIVFEGYSNDEGVVEFTVEKDSYRIQAEAEYYEISETEIHITGAGVDADYYATMEMKKVTPIFRVYAVEATTQENLSDAMVTVWSSTGNPVATVSTGDLGFAYFDGLQEGEYTVKIEKEGYYMAEGVINLDKPMSMFIPVVPQIQDKSSVMVMLEWDSDADLDLCMFNSSNSEYLTISNPVDKKNNSFIYYDNRGDDGKRYELLYIRDKQLDYAQSIYVVDIVRAQLGEPSSMEPDYNVRLTFYDHGDIYTYSPKRYESGSVWFVCYYYKGERYDQDIYQSNASDISWTRGISK